MRVNKIEIKNFRRLENVVLRLDEQTTLIVGKNNSGKTSVSILIGTFIHTKEFKFEDFSISCHDSWRKAYKLWQNLQEAKNAETIQDIQKNLISSIPKISLRLFIKYYEDDNLASLSPFILDLDDNMQNAGIEFTFSPKDALSFFDEVDEDDCIDFIKNSIGNLYEKKVSAFDCEDETNIYVFDDKAKSKINDLLLVSFIFAQRDLEDDSQKESKKLATNLGKFFNKHAQTEEEEEEIAAYLDKAQLNWNYIYKVIFKELDTDLEKFNIPGQDTQRLGVKADFNIKNVLSGSTAAYFTLEDNTELPESYEGLGYRNFILIILRLISFVKENISKEPQPDLHLIFIEEPEAHLHPQMQSAFIKNVNDFMLAKGRNVQVIITTHSSHIVADSAFSSIRYFDISCSRYVTIKDFRDFEFSYKKNANGKDTIKFLKRYMTLQRCDLFFADKAVLVEGPSERILLPAIVKKIDSTHGTNLESQYITTIEVGGDYAIRFKDLLDFIGIRTLIITDIDSIDKAGNKSKVAHGETTTNRTLRGWIPGIESISDLLKCDNIEKQQGKIRITYQIPDNHDGMIGRSFEEAFIIAQGEKFNKDDYPSITPRGNIIINDTSDYANYISSKINFAFDILLLSDWQVPKYIVDGLVWLSKNEGE